MKEASVKKLSIVIALASLAFAGVATAAGEQPDMFEETVTASTPTFNFSCTPYGYSYDMVATFTVTRRYIRFYENGALVKEIRHVHFKGTLYRSDDRSRTIPYAGTWTVTTDVAANTATNTGLFRYSHPDGSGMVT
jgi:predicted nucleic acid-binding Zn ribbon protein